MTPLVLMWLVGFASLVVVFAGNFNPVAVFASGWTWGLIYAAVTLAK